MVSDFIVADSSEQKEFIDKKIEENQILLLK